MCEKSPCPIPGISLSHYVTLDKVISVPRALISLVKIENGSTELAPKFKHLMYYADLDKCKNIYFSFLFLLSSPHLVKNIL